MAYNDKTQSNSTATGFGAHAPKAPEAHVNSGGKSTAQMLSHISAPMAHNGSGEALTTVYENMKLVMAKETNLGNFKLLPIDGQANGLNVSSVLMYAKNPHVDNAYVVYTFLVGASVGVLRPRVAKFQEGQYDIPVVLSDLYGPTLREANFAILASAIGANEDTALTDAGGNAFPRSMALDDLISFRTVIYHGVYAMNSIFVDDAEEPQVYDLTDKASNVYFHGDMDFRPGLLQNGVGSPVRRDVTIAITAVDGVNGQDASDQTYATSHLLSNCSAYFDIVFTGKKPPVQQYYGGPVVEPTQMFTAKCCIVDTTTMAGVTPELQIMTLASATKLSSGQYTQAWTNMFNPAVGGANTLHDISALSIELGLSPIDTTAPDWNPLEFCKMFVDEQLVYALHVEDVGDLSWMHKMLKAAAENNAQSRREDAKSYIWEAADNLTGNKTLSQYVKPTDPICYIEDDRIFLGHYFDSTGQKRDLREIDYLWALKNYGNSELPTVIDFGSTFNPETGPLDLRLGKRKLLIEAMLSQSIVIEGYATPLIFDPLWLTGVQKAIADVGGEPKFEHLLQGQHTQQREYHALRQYGMAAIAPAAQYQAAAGYYSGYYDPRFAR